MNEAEFTKGPMYYEPFSGCVREAENDVAVAQVFNNDEHVNPDYVRPLPQAANGHLFAAATDNYDELKVAYDQAMAQFTVGDRYATFHRQMVEAWGMSLAKARGESQNQGDSNDET